jgi:heat shock protein HspQ
MTKSAEQNKCEIGEDWRHQIYAFRGHFIIKKTII